MGGLGELRVALLVEFGGDLLTLALENVLVDALHARPLVTVLLDEGV